MEASAANTDSQKAEGSAVIEVTVGRDLDHPKTARQGSELFAGNFQLLQARV